MKGNPFPITSISHENDTSTLTSSHTERGMRLDCAKSEPFPNLNDVKMLRWIYSQSLTVNGSKEVVKMKSFGNLSQQILEVDQEYIVRVCLKLLAPCGFL